VIPVPCGVRAGVRRTAARALAIAPAALLVGTDVALRRAQLAQYTREAIAWYAGCAMLGAVAWGALVVAAARRRTASRWIARGLLVTLAPLAIGTQLETWARYRAYLNWRTALMGCSLWPCVTQDLWGCRARVLGLLIAPVAVLLGLVASARHLAPPRRRAGAFALPIGVLALAAAAAYGQPAAGWDSGTTPDVLWLNAAGALAKSIRSHEDIMVELQWLPTSRSPDTLPVLHASPPGARNVLLIIDESVRASDVCSSPAPQCEEAPFTNALLPRRFGFTHMRAVDSTTTLSIAALMSGMSPSEPRATLLSAPMLPEFAHAANVDTAFWTAQNLLFANSGRFLDGLPFTAFVSGTELAPYATYETGADDAALLDRALADLPRLRTPYLAIAQLSNTHFPYVVDDRDLPFSSHSDWRRMDTFGRSRVRYRDAIHRQDKILAHFLEKLRGQREGDRTIVVFLSDHGEQIGERGRIGHTWSVYDEEIRVPMWIDAPAGTLTDDEAANLRALQETPLTMLDVAPTVLDLLGVWQDPAIATWRSRMSGASLLRGGPPAERAVIVTNCSEIYSCATKNWGAMRGTKKLLATEDEGGPWRCFDVAQDPSEVHDLGAAACGDLRDVAEAGGRGTPY
jgi:hypothetical protein